MLCFKIFKRWNRTILGAALYLCTVSIHGQSDPYPISSNQIELLRFGHDIPALNSALDIIQGPQGHIWISGNGGLIRYNGSSFKVFNLKNTESLKNEKFEFLASDHKKGIYVSSPSGVSFVSNGILQPIEAMDSLNQIASLSVDKNGVLWIINDKILYKYSNDKLVSVNLLEEEIIQVITLNDRSVWALGTNHIYLLSEASFKSYKSKTPIIDKFHGGGIDKEGFPFFISNFQEPLILNNNQFEIASWAWIFSEKLIRGIAQDINGLLWFTGSGIQNTDFDQVDAYNFSQVFFQNKTYHLCIDKEFTKWIIGEEGIWIIRDTKAKSIYLEGRGDKIFSKATSGILPLGDSIALVGTHGEGIRFLRDHKLRHSKTKLATGDVIYGLYKDEENYISHSNAGTFKFRLEGHNFYNLDTLIRDVTFLYFKDKTGTEYLNILRNNDERSVVYKKDEEFYNIPELNGMNVFEIVETKSHGIVFCTAKGVFSLKKGEVINLMKNYNIPVDEVLSAWEDPHTETLFVGTSGSGLVRISKNGIKIFNTNNGFPTNTVSNIMPYNDNLIVTGRKELFQFDIQNLLENKGDSTSLPSYSNIDLNHEVYVMGSQNIVEHNNKILINTKTGISEIDLGNENESFLNLIVESVHTADSTFVAPSSVDLEANVREVSINFSTIRFVNNKHSKFSYKLEGFEESWKSANGQSSVNYPKLPPGSYVFRLREQHSNGSFVYADPVTIYKEKPWYLLGPMYFIYALAAVFLVERIIAYRTRVIKIQNEKLQAEVNRQTIALQKSIERTEETVVQRTKELREANILLQKEEERLNRAFEISKDGIWDWNLETDKITISNAVYTMLGYEPNEFPSKLMAIMKRVHPSDRKKEEFKYFVDPKRIPEQGFETELRMIHKSDKYFWVKIKVNTYGHLKGDGPERMVGVITDISSEKEKQQQILEAIVKTENLERSRISRDIHDGLQQTLTITQLNLNQLKKFMAELPQTALEKYDTCKDYLTRSIAESRNVAHTLMPRSISDLGLVRSVENLVESLNESNPSTNFVFSQNIENDHIKSEEVLITMYRVLQEALNNVIKYAQASQVNIQLLKHDDILTMTIEDNGIGFDRGSIDKNSFGLNSMANRMDAIDGFLEIDGIVGTGTFVIAEANNVFEV